MGSILVMLVIGVMVGIVRVDVFAIQAGCIHLGQNR